MQKMIRFLFLLSALGIGGCQESVLPLDDLPSSLILIKTRNSDGKLIIETSKQVIQSTDPVYQRLDHLLKKEKRKWQKNYVSYASGYYIFLGKNIIINCYSDVMIIDIENSGNRVSLKKQIPNLLEILGLPL